MNTLAEALATCVYVLRDYERAKECCSPASFEKRHESNCALVRAIAKADAALKTSGYDETRVGVAHEQSITTTTPVRGPEEAGAISEEAPGWRTGRKVHRTLYLDGKLIGLVDTPELATGIVDQMNQHALDAFAKRYGFEP